MDWESISTSKLSILLFVELDACWWWYTLCFSDLFYFCKLLHLSFWLPLNHDYNVIYFWSEKKLIWTSQTDQYFLFVLEKICDSNLSGQSFVNLVNNSRSVLADDLFIKSLSVFVISRLIISLLTGPKIVFLFLWVWKKFIIIHHKYSFPLVLVEQACLGEEDQGYRKIVCHTIL